MKCEYSFNSNKFNNFDRKIINYQKNKYIKKNIY